tara:strand:+ start:832 stop:1230 length:399 start_codon:yes stop_codon:yes gene_type:complete
VNGAPLSACAARTAHDTHSAVRALDPLTTLALAPTSSDSLPTDAFLPLVTVLDLDDALDRVPIVRVTRLGPPLGRPSSSSPLGRPSSRVRERVVQNAALRTRVSARATPRLRARVHLGTARIDPSMALPIRV